ncbi:oxidoreductase [Saxibacter everestensis]|uniref:Oxidoreductase n=1 Tax=Saxibacter everestensis TaxID=2909229 RepID=A0ABY8QWU1_9MICO|nr:oxidoreductase [Brevibacteriaceae bacterium ZFBP1038]
MSRFSSRMKSIFRRNASQPATGSDDDSPRSRKAATISHIRDFRDTRVGVEAYIEPATASTPATMLLIATTGEWTRRAVPSEKVGWNLARELSIPVYDVNQTGYPPRMRAWTKAKRDQEKRGD